MKVNMVRKRHTAIFKARVALEAAKEIKTLSELAPKKG
jgi:outer membrane receptor for ferric coprogen and ferric-rhodotorulic acid